MIVFFTILIFFIITFSIWIIYREAVHVIKQNKLDKQSDDNEKDELKSDISPNIDDSKLDIIEEDKNISNTENQSQEEKQEVPKIINKPRCTDGSIFLSNSIIQKKNDYIIEWYYSPNPDDYYKDFQNECIEFRTSIRNNSLVNTDTSISLKLHNIDGLDSYGSVLITTQGIITLGGNIINRKRIVKPNELLISLNTSDIAIKDYKDNITNEIARRQTIETDIIALRKQRQEAQAKEKIRQKLLRQKMQRELERKVQQEMVESGELIMEGSKRRHIPHSIVSEVYHRDGGKCVLCGSTDNLLLDHIIPVSKGGADTAENLQVLCQKCNLKKSNKI